MRHLPGIVIFCVLASMNPPCQAGARRASIVFRDSSKVLAEIISVDDSSVTLTDAPADARAKASWRVRDTTRVSFGEMTRITLLGHTHALEGAGIGAALGGVIGALLGDDAARNATGDPVSVGFARGFGMWGGLLLGVVGGFFVGVIVGGITVDGKYDLDPQSPTDMNLLRGLLEEPPGAQKHL